MCDSHLSRANIITNKASNNRTQELAKALRIAGIFGALLFFGFSNSVESQTNDVVEYCTFTQSVNEDGFKGESVQRVIERNGQLILEQSNEFSDGFVEVTPLELRRIPSFNIYSGDAYTSRLDGRELTYLFVVHDLGSVTSMITFSGKNLGEEGSFISQVGRCLPNVER